MMHRLAGVLHNLSSYDVWPLQSSALLFWVNRFGLRRQRARGTFATASRLCHLQRTGRLPGRRLLSGMLMPARCLTLRQPLQWMLQARAQHVRGLSSQHGHEETRQPWRPAGSESAAPTGPGSSSTPAPDGPTANPTASSSPAAVELRAQQALHERVVADISSMLERMGLRPGIGCVVGDGLATVSLAVMAGDPPVQVAVDVVPAPVDLAPSSGGDAARPMPQQHYVQSMVRRRLLQAHGWALVQIPRVEWLALGRGSEQQRRAYLQERLAEAVADGGGGHVCSSGCSH